MPASIFRFFFFLIVGPGPREPSLIKTVSQERRCIFFQKNKFFLKKKKHVQTIFGTRRYITIFQSTNGLKV